MFIKQNVVMHGGSHHECLVVVPLSYKVFFVAHGSIFTFNKCHSGNLCAEIAIGGETKNVISWVYITEIVVYSILL
jgi:hypothetical protein